MIKITDTLWVGNSRDEQLARVDCILNVAKDLKPTRGWPQGIEYRHIGLMDGPGNPVEDYYAAVIALYGLVKTEKQTLVCCHEGKSRSMSVAIMYVHLIKTDLWVDWNWHLNVIREKNDENVPEPNLAHMAAFNRFNWKLLREIVCAG